MPLTADLYRERRAEGLCGVCGIESLTARCLRCSTAQQCNKALNRRKFHFAHYPFTALHRNGRASRGLGWALTWHRERWA